MVPNSQLSDDDLLTDLVATTRQARHLDVCSASTARRAGFKQAQEVESSRQCPVRVPPRLATLLCAYPRLEQGVLLNQLTRGPSQYFTLPPLIKAHRSKASIQPTRSAYR
jgi:hypothetical protein